MYQAIFAIYLLRPAGAGYGGSEKPKQKQGKRNEQKESVYYSDYDDDRSVLHGLWYTSSREREEVQGGEIS